MTTPAPVTPRDALEEAQGTLVRLEQEHAPLALAYRRAVRGNDSAHADLKGQLADADTALVTARIAVAQAEVDLAEQEYAAAVADPILHNPAAHFTEAHESLVQAQAALDAATVAKRMVRHRLDDAQAERTAKGEALATARENLARVRQRHGRIG